MPSASDTLRATLSATAYDALGVLATSTAPLSGRKMAAALCVAPTTAVNALGTLAQAGFVSSEKSGRSVLWRLAVSHPSISQWLEEVMTERAIEPLGSSPYSTGGGGVRLEHTYVACLVAALLAGDAVTELGDSTSADSIGLQASDVSDVDDIVVEGRDAHGELYRASIAVRRSPLLTRSDTDSVPLIRSLLKVLVDEKALVDAGRWRLVLAVSTNANAVGQLADLAELSRSLPNGAELVDRLSQRGRTNADVRGRYDHVKDLVEQAAEGLPEAAALDIGDLTWWLLSNLTVRVLRLERTDRADRTAAVNTLQRILQGGTPATADALFSRVEELVGTWAPQGAVLTQSVLRRSLREHPLNRSPRFSSPWSVIDRLGLRLRDSIRPSLDAGSDTLELERAAERSRIHTAMNLAGSSVGSLIVTGDPDVGKSALCLRVAEMLRYDGAAITTLSLRDLPQSTSEFEHLLHGFSLNEILAAGEARPVRLLLVDGTESVLEGQTAVFRTLSAAALSAGVGVVAVTRTDGSRQVRDVLTRAGELAGTGSSPTELVLGPFTENERNQLAATFPTLARLGSNPRSSWLLGRPGLVDLLLRTGNDLDPADFLCEADVFSVVWRSLIRSNENRDAGRASPDDRERATLSTAKNSLGLPSEGVAGTATAELRSDGVLRLPNNPALSPRDEFSSDLFRDFAVCRLFMVDGWQPLTTAGAPRWLIRATRLRCQVALTERDTPNAWNALSVQFATISHDHGARWAEVPFEALLTLGNAESAIRELWDALNADDGAALATLLRLADARYVNGTVGDPYALAPFIQVAFCEQRVDGIGSRGGHRTVGAQLGDLVLAWLRGMAVSYPQSDGLRQAVRDRILDDNPERFDEFAIEALATLGADVDDRADEWLRGVAREHPGNLASAVESLAVSLSMSQARPELLLTLAEAYYIELPDPRDRWGGGRSLDDGIRDFRHGPGLGFGVPAAAWHYGPFFRLLNTRPMEAIGFINRMLNHAAMFRVRKMSSYRSEGESTDDVEGARFDLVETGQRLFVGDNHVWAWYRGTGVGPYACMSALLALERFADDLLERVGIPAQRIVELLLTDCTNLAVPGVLVGFLIRHPKAAGNLLDPFLAHLDAWNLETARVTADYGFKVRDSDADKLTGNDRRRYTFHEVVGEMVVQARIAANEDRLTELRALGDTLVQSARARLLEADGDNTEYLATVESWAAEFRFENYSVSTRGNQVQIQFVRPEPIERILAPRNDELQTTSLLYGLQNRYGRYNSEPHEWPVDDLVEDLATARRIEEDSGALESISSPENGLVSVAAAAVHAHSLGDAIIDDTSLQWAVEALLWAAENPRIDDMSYYESTFPIGADRAAAAALPLLLLAPFDRLHLDQDRLHGALEALASSLFDEVRAIYVKGCEPLWDDPCDLDAITGTCRRHTPAWAAAVGGLRDCRLGSWDYETQGRENDPLPPPFNETLPTVTNETLMVNRLRMPLSCAVDARKVPCLRDDVQRIWAPLWDAYRRGIAHWWKEGYDHRAEDHHEPLARRMIEIASDTDMELVTDFVETLATNSNALHLLFDGFAAVFTYDDDARTSMGEFWPHALATALNALDATTDLRTDHHWFDYMVAALLPTPQPHSWDPDIDATLKRSRKNWIQPEALDQLIGRWLDIARRQPKAVDAVIKFSKSAPTAWTSSVALDWIETIIDGRPELIANRLFYLEEWLGQLRSDGLILGEAETRYHRILDGLAAAGDLASVRLQQLDE